MPHARRTCHLVAWVPLAILRTRCTCCMCDTAFRRACVLPASCDPAIPILHVLLTPDRCVSACTCNCQSTLQGTSLHRHLHSCISVRSDHYSFRSSKSSCACPRPSCTVLRTSAPDIWHRALVPQSAPATLRAHASIGGAQRRTHGATSPPRCHPEPLAAS